MSLNAAIKRTEERLVGRRSCYRAYSCLFIPFAFIVFLGLLISRRGFIWNVDGLGQYYPFFVYEGQWLREIARGLLSGNGLQLPLWEWCSGYGADIPTTFDVFLDPINLVSGITPPAISEWVFHLLVLLRIYLSGLAFVFYCRTRDENRTGTVLGALLYALCGAALTGVRWSSGLHALMLFPVILAGAERILAGRRPWVFVVSLSLLAIVSYYFTYMACILLVGYLAIRVVMIERPNLTARRFFRWVAIFASLVVLCIVIAGFVLVPAAMAIAGMDRLVDQQTTVPLFYDVSYYRRLATCFLSTFEVGSDTQQGFGGLAFLACALMFTRRRANGALKLVFVLLTVFLALPYVGSFLNVLNYASNRWAWAYAMCVAFVLVRMTPELLEPSTRTKIVLVLATALYGLVFLVPECRTEANVAGYIALLGALVLVCVPRLMSSSEDAQRPGRHFLARKLISPLPLVCALALTLGVNAFWELATIKGGKASGQTPLGIAYALLTTTSNDHVATTALDGTWWRYDQGQLPADRIGRVPNGSLVLGLQGIDFYNSVYNDHIDAFHTEMAIAGDDINFRYANLQSRSDLMALLGVRYYVYRNDGTDALPYGFTADRVRANENVLGLEHQLVEADSSLPIGIAFDKVISRDDYLALTPAKRQQAVLQAVVLDEKSGHAAKPAATRDLTFEDATVPFSVAESNGITFEDGRFVVAGFGSSITFAVEGTSNADTYVYLQNLEYELHEGDAVSGYDIEMRSDVCQRAGHLTNGLPNNHMYGGKDTWLVNLGYAAEPARSVTLTFNTPGTYTFDDLQIVTQTHKNLATWMQQRDASSLHDFELGRNRFTGSIDLETPQTLLLTIATSPGWQAYVDGKPTELLRADTGFMALDLEKGHHDIELVYQTPGLMLGGMISAAGLVALVVLAIVLRISKKGVPLFEKSR